MISADLLMTPFTHHWFSLPAPHPTPPQRDREKMQIDVEVAKQSRMIYHTRTPRPNFRVPKTPQNADAESTKLDEKQHTHQP